MTILIARTVDVTIEMTPEELAAVFCAMNSNEQAVFFHHIWLIAKDWPGAGLCQQSYSIMAGADDQAKNAIETIASHLPKETLERMAGAV